MPRYIPTILLVAVLLLIPAAIYIERTEPKVWNQRLFIPNLEDEPNFHTPIHAAGTFLPPVISKDTTYTGADNPVLLTTSTRIEPGIFVTFEAGTLLFAHEFAALDVRGTLRMQGSTSQPVTITTNEAHDDNQVWNGILFQAGSIGSINHTEIRHASPGISCLKNSSVSVDNSEIVIGSVGVYQESDSCRITNSLIQGVRDGIIAIGVNVQIQNTTIIAKENDVRTF